MSEMSFEQMLEESLKSVHAGEIVTGTVISVKPDEIALNIGYKSDGIMTRSDYSADNQLDLTTVVSVGDEIECKVKKVNDGEGQVVLSHRDALQSKASEELRKAFEENAILTGKVVQVVKGGLNVEVDGARIFVPASLVSDSSERDVNKYQGQDIQFVITEFNPAKRRIIGDRKQIMSAMKKEQHDKLFSELQEGDIRTGVVKNLTDFGAFIELDKGIDALLHVSQISKDHVNKPSDVLEPGQEIEARVVDLDVDNHKISLSIKALLPEDEQDTADVDVAAASEEE